MPQCGPSLLRPLQPSSLTRQHLGSGRCDLDGWDLDRTHCTAGGRGRRATSLRPWLDGFGTGVTEGTPGHAPPVPIEATVARPCGCRNRLKVSMTRIRPRQ